MLTFLSLMILVDSVEILLLNI